MIPNPCFWHKFTVSIPARFEAEASARLVALGTHGVWVEEENDVIFLNVFFPGNLPKEPLLESIRKSLAPLTRDEGLPVAAERLREEEWQSAWQRHSIPAQNIGKRLRIIPPWENPGGSHGKRKVIRLSPGMAFGTGTHPTTKSCLIFLEKVLTGKNGGRVLDLGTGSGILAIAAAKLGAGKVTAVETDPVALDIARDNARSNRVSSKIILRPSIPDRGRYSVVVANLTAPLLLEYHQSLVRAVPPGGKIILSGLMKGDRQKIASRYRNAFSPVSTKIIEGWVTLLMKRR